MKDNRFIELVNLYVDRQITAEETAELEAELQASPRRRSVYRQYCQMHRATALVYDSFRAHAPEQNLAETDENVVVARFDREQTRHRTPWGLYAGGLAAACLAMVFVVRQNSSQPVELIGALPVKARQTVAAVVAKPAPEAAKPALVTEAPKGLVSLRNNSLTANQDYAAMLLELRREELRTVASGQAQPGRLPSLFEDGVFDSQPALPANNHRIFRPTQSPTQQAEFTAFQFQR
jgi:anti-sigma factor RsiW